MKKTFLFLFSMCLICGLGILTTACGPHTHNAIEVAATPATCEENGNERYFFCESCGKYFLDEECKIEVHYEDLIILASHQYGNWIQTKAPTCAEEGSQYKECSKCHDRITQSIPKTSDHIFNDWIEISPATCTTNGEKQRQCSVCHKIEKQPIYSTGHSYGNWTQSKEPTCAEEGSQYKECSKCHDRITQSIPKTTNHNYGDWQDEIPATCTTKGTQKHICQTCGKIEYKDSETIPHSIENSYSHDEQTHWKQCSVCHQKFSSGSHVFVDPTENLGIKTYTCSTCSYQKEELPTVLDAYGDGTLSNPYLIYTGEQFLDMFKGWGYLKKYREKALNVKLMRDISLMEAPQFEHQTINPYAYLFDGNGKTITTNCLNIFPYLSGEIKDLTVELSGNLISATGKYQLVSRILESGKISNIILASKDGFIGGYTGFTETNYGTIDNCKNYLSANVNNYCYAGIASSNYGTISNTMNFANLSTTNYNLSSLSGIVQSNYGTISNCANYGKISFNNSSTSGTYKSCGIAGTLYAGSKIINCKNYGELTYKSSGILFGSIGISTMASESDRKNITIKGCVYIQNEVVNTNITWLFKRSEYINDRTIDDVYSDENVLKLFPNVQIPTSVSEIPQEDKIST